MVRDLGVGRGSVSAGEPRWIPRTTLLVGYRQREPAVTRAEIVAASPRAPLDTTNGQVYPGAARHIDSEGGAPRTASRIERFGGIA